MGEQNSATSKGSSTANQTQLPSWATPGSSQYNNMNTALQTAPMAAAVNTFSNGGIGQAGRNAINTLQNSSGSNAWMNQAASGLQNPGQIGYGVQNAIAQSAPNVGQVGGGNYQTVYNEAQQPGAAQQYLSNYASGDYLNGSPELQNVIGQTNKAIADQTNAMFAGGGRYGSGANQDVLQKNIAQNTSNLLYNNYNQQQQNQMNAANAIENAEQGRLGQQLSAAGGLANVQNQNIGNRLAGQNLGLNAANAASNIQGQNIGNQLGADQALGSLGQNVFSNQTNNLLNTANLENQGFSNQLGMIQQLPTIQSNKTYDATQQQNVGSNIDQYTQQELQNLENQYSNIDMQPWAALGGLMSAGTTSAGNWGTQTAQSTQPISGLGSLLSSILTAHL